MSILWENYANRLSFNDINNNSPYIVWTVTVRSNPNTGNTTIVIQLSAHCEKKKNRFMKNISRNDSF